MLHTPLNFPQLKLLPIIAIAAILALTGCSHRPPGDGPRGEPPAAAVPNMSAEDTFFDGALLVEASLGRGFSARGAGGAPGGGRGEPGGGGGGRRGGGGMSMGMGMGGGGPGGPGGGDMGEMPSTSRGGGMGGHAMHESNQPPVALRLRLTNKSKEAVEVKFVLCKSDLGDFAVRPEKLALAPDQTAEPDPMTSRLGIPAGDLVLRVSLRIGGKTEQKDLVLRKVTVNEPSPTNKP